MKELEEIILKKGKVLAGDVLKIDNFLNHQIDVKLVKLIGKEFYELFKDTRPDKILTIEASGISIAVETADFFNCIPVVYAKKTNSSNQSKEVYSALEHSYTRNIEYNVTVSKEYLKEKERVLIIDDFLANGEAICALLDICLQAKATVVGAGAVVCKTYQKGKQRILDRGINLKCLANIKSMALNHIEFED